MPETPTPGQRAYEAYLAALQLSLPRPWADVPLTMQAAWEAAAEAVLDAWLAQPRLETPPRKEHDDAT